MPSKLKTISVRLPDDVREWVEAQPGSAAGFVADLVTDRFLGPPEYMLKDEAEPPAPEFVQLKNPMSDRWVKVDKTTGAVVSTKKTVGPYKDIKQVHQPKRDAASLIDGALASIPEPTPPPQRARQSGEPTADQLAFRKKMLAPKAQK